MVWHLPFYHHFDHLFGHKWHASLSHHHSATVLSTNPWENFTRLIRTILGPLERGEQGLIQSTHHQPPKATQQATTDQNTPICSVKNKTSMSLICYSNWYRSLSVPSGWGQNISLLTCWPWMTEVHIYDIVPSWGMSTIPSLLACCQIQPSFYFWVISYLIFTVCTLWLLLGGNIPLLLCWPRMTEARTYDIVPY